MSVSEVCVMQMKKGWSGEKNHETLIFRQHLKIFVYKEASPSSPNVKYCHCKTQKETCDVTFRFCSRPPTFTVRNTQETFRLIPSQTAHPETPNRNKTYLFSFIRLSPSKINVQIVKWIASHYHYFCYFPPMGVWYIIK